MASYLEQYNAPTVNPFKTDYEGMLRGIQTKEAYWKIGVQNVKSAYEQAAGLSLTGKTAKDRLQGFMTNADKELKKALASDVSISDNAANAINIYKPLYQDQEIIGNHNITEHYKSQFDTINTFRTKDGGKEYNDVNARDVMNSYADFAKGIDEGRSSSEFEGTKRSYTPYVDVTEKSFDILKNCKPNDITRMGGAKGNDLLFEEIQTKGLSAAKLTTCLDASLDSKYKNQLLINQRVNYHNNPQALGQAWLSIANQDINQLTFDYQTAKNNANANLKNPEDKKYFEDYAANVAEQIKNKQKTIANIAKGDYSDINNNFDQYAYQVGVYSHVKTFANAFSYENIRQELSANPAAMLLQNQNFQREQTNFTEQNKFLLNNQEFAIAQQLNQQKSDLSIAEEFFKKTGTVITAEGLANLKIGKPIDSPFEQPIQSVETDATKIIKEGESYKAEKFNQLTAAQSIIAQVDKDFKNNPVLKADQAVLDAMYVTPDRILNPDITSNPEVVRTNLQNIVSNYKKDPSNSKINPSSINEIQKYLDKTAPQLKEIERISTLNKIYQDKVNQSIGPDEQKLNEKLVKEVTTFTLPNGQKAQITGKQLKDLITSGKSGDFIAKTFTTSTPNLGGSGSISSKTTAYYYKGQLIYGDNPDNKLEGIDVFGSLSGKYKRASPEFHDNLLKVNSRYSKLINKRKELENQIYGQAYWDTKTYYDKAFIKDKAQNEIAENAVKKRLDLENLTTDEKKTSTYTLKGYGTHNDLYVKVNESTFKKYKDNKDITGYIEPKSGDYMLVIPVPQGVAPSNNLPKEFVDNKTVQELNNAFVQHGATDNKPLKLLNDVSIKGNKIRLVGTKNNTGISYAIEVFNPTTERFEQSTTNPANYNNPNINDILSIYNSYKQNN